MFDQIHQQNLADWILNQIDRLPRPLNRKIAIEALQMFERAPWQPQLFQAAVEAICKEGFQIGDGIVEIEGNASQLIPRLLYNYLYGVNALKPLTLKQAHVWLAERDLFQANGQPYTLTAINKARERGQLAARREDGPVQYFTVTLDDLLGWYWDPDRHVRGPKAN